MDGYPFTSLAFFYTEQLLTSRCLLVVIGAIIGIVTTSAASDILGVSIGRLMTFYLPCKNSMTILRKVDQQI